MIYAIKDGEVAVHYPNSIYCHPSVLIESSPDFRMLALLGSNYGRDRSFIAFNKLGHSVMLPFMWRSGQLSPENIHIIRRVFRKHLRVEGHIPRPISKRDNPRRRIQIAKERHKWNHILDNPVTE